MATCFDAMTALKGYGDGNACPCFTYLFYLSVGKLIFAHVEDAEQVAVRRLRQTRDAFVTAARCVRGDERLLACRALARGGYSASPRIVSHTGSESVAAPVSSVARAMREKRARVKTSRGFTSALHGAVTRTVGEARVVVVVAKPGRAMLPLFARSVSGTSCVLICAAGTVPLVAPLAWYLTV
jgi:hypothetical protein